MGRWLFFLATICLCIPLLAGCTDDDCDGEGNGKGRDTYIHLNVSTAALLSRATKGNYSPSRASDQSPANPDAESDIHSIRVWAFNTDITDEGAYPVSYKEEVNLTKNSQHSLSMKIPRLSGGTELKHLDLFILANAESGSTLAGDYSKKMITRQELQDAKFTQRFIIDDTSGKPLTTAVPKEGLPISRVVSSINVDDYKQESATAGTSTSETGSSTSPAKSLNIPLVRAVSKMHFFFARKAEGFASEAEITKIELDANTLPRGGYVFPDAAPYADIATKGLQASGSTDYIPAKAQLSGIASADIMPVENPESFRRGTTEDAEAYLTRLASHGILSHDLAYWNETTQPITGTIYYKVYKTGEERQARLAFPAGTAVRNHELVVYGYFNAEGQLVLNYEILPWVTNEVNVVTKDLKYLNVYPSLVLMKNVASNEEINFFASNTCTVEIKEVYYYDKNNKKQLITSSNTAQYPSIILDGTKSGKVKISSPIPTNKTVKYIRFRIKLAGSSDYREVLAKQYPLEYAQNIVGKYSSRSKSGWVSDQSEGGTYRDYSFYSNRSTQYGYQAKIYQDGDIKYYHGGTTVGASSGNSNNLMYVIQITSTNGKYVIAHPKLKADGSSDDHVVSPAFMIASQLGAVLSGGFNKDTAITHSRTYREVASDGTIYDNWRLPTNEEIAIIIEYQGKENSPIDNVLTGANYRTLSKETKATGIKGADEGNFVRCVRDLTPEEVAKLEQGK